MINEEDHKKRHIELHKKFDELLADFIANNEGTVLDSTIRDLVSWAHKQTIQPDHELQPQTMTSEPLENVEDAKELFKNDPVFKRFVNGIIGLLKDKLLTPEQVLTGCVLATGEYEYHIEPNEKKGS